MEKCIRPAPILTLEEFCNVRPTLKGKVVLTSGGFDPPHPGHTSCIAESAAFGDYVVVVVNGDAFLRAKKGTPFMDLATRCALVSYMIGVDYVVSFEIENDPTVCVALEQIKPDVFSKGGDRVDASTIPEWDVCQKNNIQIITGVGDPKIHSSSTLLEDWYQRRLSLFGEKK